MTRRSWIVTVALVATASPGRAMAQPAQEDDSVVEQARTLFEQGMAAYEAGDVAGAADLFDQSVELRPNATALYNLAMCRRELGEKDAAISTFQRYVDLRGAELPAEERSEIEAMVVDLGGVLAASPGPVQPPTTTVQPPAGGDEEDNEEGVDPLWFWTTAGVAVAAGVGAAVTGGLAYSTHEDFTGGGRTDADLHDQGETLQLTTNLLAGLAGAAAVAALVLVFVTEFGAEETGDDGSGITVAAGPGGLVVTW